MGQTDLEQDLWENFLKDVQDRKKAVELYGSLCNLKWIKNQQDYTMSWRYAGRVVADLRNYSLSDSKEKEDYLDFYCSGNEGHVSPWVEEKLNQLGYKKETYS